MSCCLAVSCFWSWQVHSFQHLRTALFSLGPSTLRQWGDDGTPNQKLAARLLVDHHGTLVAILLGTNFVNNMTAILVNRVAQAYELPAASVIAVVISTVVVLILGEITPKTIAFTKAEALAPKAARLLSYLIAPLRPFIFVIRGVSGRLLRLFGKGVQSVAITVEEYRTFLAMGEKAGAFPARELDMLNGILALRETKASQAMTPRVEVCTVDASDDIESVYVRMRQGPAIVGCPWWMATSTMWSAC